MDDFICARMMFKNSSYIYEFQLRLNQCMVLCFRHLVLHVVLILSLSLSRPLVLVLVT